VLAGLVFQCLVATCLGWNCVNKTDGIFFQWKGSVNA
jgi:hypothetical protein